MSFKNLYTRITIYPVSQKGVTFFELLFPKICFLNLYKTNFKFKRGKLNLKKGSINIKFVHLVGNILKKTYFFGNHHSHTII